MPIVWEFPDGTVRTTRLVPSWVEANRHKDETTTDAVTRLAEIVRAKTPDLKPATLRVLSSSSLPPDKSARHAWRIEGERVVVNRDLPAPPRSNPLVDALKDPDVIAAIRAALR